MSRKKKRKRLNLVMYRKKNEMKLWINFFKMFSYRKVWKKLIFNNLIIKLGTWYQVENVYQENLSICSKCWLRSLEILGQRTRIEKYIHEKLMPLLFSIKVNLYDRLTLEVAYVTVSKHSNFPDFISNTVARNCKQFYTK